MKKAWKIILSIVLILIVGAAGSGYYLLKVKTYDVADKKVEEITKAEYKIELPGETTAVGPASDQNQQSPETAGTASESTSASTSGSQTGTSSKQMGTSGSKAGTSHSTAAAAQKVTAQTIKAKYLPTFQSLESQANGRINSLVGAAMNEYSQKKANGESISVGYFFQKYSGAGRSLEGQTDAAFNYIYSALQNELKRNGFSPDSAKSLKASYEQSKKARETALLQQAKSAL